MSRNFPADTFKQRFMEELYNKETSTRLGWYMKNSKEADSQDGISSRQYEVCRKKMLAACPRPTSALQKIKDQYQPVSYHKRIRKFDESCGLPAGVTSEASMLDMLPPDQNIKKELYDGFTKEEKGRYRYLKSRNKDGPEDKYQLPMLSSWEYGWGLKEMMSKDDIKKPEHGRRMLVTDTFYARNGISTLQVPASQ